MIQWFNADHVAPSIRKSWQSLRRQAAVGIVRSRTQTMEFSFRYSGYVQHASEISILVSQDSEIKL
jgi:hypothetical protein